MHPTSVLSEPPLHPASDHYYYSCVVATLKMMREYQMILQNSTIERPGHFAVYQKMSESPGLSSVAWQVRNLAPQGPFGPPTQTEVPWGTSYGVCLADFNGSYNFFMDRQSYPAILSNQYQVVSVDGIPSISPIPIGRTAADQITLKNNTMQPVTMGFTVSGNIIAAEQNVGGGQEIVFRANPTYYVACYRNIELGQPADEGVAFGPIEVNYDSVPTHTVQAYQDQSGNYHLRVVD